MDIETIILDEDNVYDMQLEFGEGKNAGTEYNTLEILYLAVKESYRCQGIGSICIDKIISIAQQSSALGVRFITVDAYKSSDYTAAPFYGRHHFINVEYLNPNKDTIRMIRPVDVRDYEEWKREWPNKSFSLFSQSSTYLSQASATDTILACKPYPIMQKLTNKIINLTIVAGVGVEPTTLSL